MLTKPKYSWTETSVSQPVSLVRRWYGSSRSTANMMPKSHPLMILSVVHSCPCGPTPSPNAAYKQHMIDNSLLWFIYSIVFYIMSLVLTCVLSTHNNWILYCIVLYVCNMHHFVLISAPDTSFFYTACRIHQFSKVWEHCCHSTVTNNCGTTALEWTISYLLHCCSCQLETSKHRSTSAACNTDNVSVSSSDNTAAAAVTSTLRLNNAKCREN